MQREDCAPLAQALEQLTGAGVAPSPEREVGGGSINECYRWPARAAALFVKVAPADSLPVFEAESAGLAELAAAKALRVPAVRACGSAARHAFLALEWIEAARADAASERRLGEGLAALHAVTAARFGWTRDNTIGRTAQANAWSTDWTTFFRERRLRPQLELAAANGFKSLSAPGDRLLAALPALLAGHAPSASLLHGDLWGGNWFTARDGTPVVFDPAVYYGDREADLAMTHLFGGFGAGFYRAYEAVAPLPPGATPRRDLYQLYHVLNHANLFGGGYAGQARALILALLAAGGH
jgi:protein-ribulosamine 3-kinase